MASDLMDKLKETLQPTGEESHGVHFGESQQTEQRESVPSNTRTENLESTRVEQTQQTEGVRTGDEIQSLVENVPGVPSTQAKPERTETRREEIHQASRDPCDAAQAPPSALRQHVGDPSIEHDYPEDSTTRRHSSVSHQEAHYNLG
ncbi:hypothetical protein NCS57_00177600 [Fusarium keratoplasticum]|uniref:Uncharacterized protein n=1 Tax=Fusarium keratoplasticum TaxID=1328300 RepID=A0ACC0RHL3_9HYPO|nr:hypothetical protein NCS57_00177600 [Fusarium keratoplasticum]KAI8685095.1 hypothetical protein NCS57_00177600 [Fusarium keratoplasticum]